MSNQSPQVESFIVSIYSVTVVYTTPLEEAACVDLYDGVSCYTLCLHNSTKKGMVSNMDHNHLKNALHCTKKLAHLGLGKVHL